MEPTNTISYADDIWDDFANDENLIHECADLIYATHATPRTLDFVTDYIEHQLPGGRIYIYGAGSHTRSILPTLENRKDITILGIVDMRAGIGLDSYLGYTVVTPDHLICSEPNQGPKHDYHYDYVLLSHTDREPEMATALNNIGVDTHKIRPLYGHSSYREYVLSRRTDWPKIPTQPKINAVIISTTYPHNCLIPNELLSDIFPQHTTLEIYMGRPNEWAPGDVFDKINLHQSLMMLDEALSRLRPKCIYFRNTVQASLGELPLYIHDKFPGIKVIRETYDVGCFLEDKRMRSMWGFSDDTIRRARLGEIYSFRYEDAFIHKNVGELWNSFTKTCEADSLLYYPGVSPHQQDSLPISYIPKDKTITIVYPAGLSANGKIVSPDIHKTLELLSTLETVSETKGVNIHLYNHYHQGSENDEAFAYYINRYKNTSVDYHPYVTHETLLKEISQFDFGWLYFEETPMFPLENLWKIGLPNKFTDYVQAGLPTLVSDMFSCVAEIVDRYSAGIVVPTNDPGQIPALLKSVDIASLREGTKHLLRDMQQGNQKTLNHLKKIAFQHPINTPSKKTG